MSQITSESFFDQLLNELCVEISFKSFQKQITMNSVCLHCNQKCGIINEKAGLDIYGNRIDINGGIASSSSNVTFTPTNNSTTDSMNTGTCMSNGMLTVECPCCKKVLAATRFAPHLEKCMGMGRQSTRKRGNLVIKAGGDSGHVGVGMGSDNDSYDETVDYSGNYIRTPAQSITEDSFSPTTIPLNHPSDPKKAKISPAKGKSSVNSSGGNNSKTSSPSKVKRERATPLKGKSINLKK